MRNEELSDLISAGHWAPKVVPATVDSRDGAVYFQDLDTYTKMLSVVGSPTVSRPSKHLTEIAGTLPEPEIRREDSTSGSEKVASVCIEICHSPEHHGDKDAWIRLKNHGFLDAIHVRATDPAVEFSTAVEVDESAMPLREVFTMGGPGARPGEWYPMVATLYTPLYVRVPANGSVKVCATMLPHDLRNELGKTRYPFSVGGKQWVADYGIARAT